jgi:hypothetical protein
MYSNGDYLRKLKSPKRSSPCTGTHRKGLEIEQTKNNLCQGKLSTKMGLFSDCTYVQ